MYYIRNTGAVHVFRIGSIIENIDKIAIGLVHVFENFLEFVAFLLRRICTKKIPKHLHINEHF